MSAPDPPLSLRTQLAAYFTKAWEAAQTAHISVLRVIVEQIALYLLHQVDVRTYFTYRLFEPHLSWTDKTTYLPSDKSKSVRPLLTMHMPTDSWEIYGNKVTFNYVFRHLPVPNIHAVFRCYTPTPLPVEYLEDEAALDQWMRTTDITDLVYKPVFGSHGELILVFTGRDANDSGTLVTLSGDRYNAARLAAHSGNTPMLFQRRVHQHPELVALMGETLCCVRVVTMVPLDGKPAILGATFKLQASSLGVDHLIYGAVGSWVDLVTGRLSKGRTRFGLDFTWQVPGSDRSFEGFQLPLWDEVKALALASAATIPEARSVGWDVAITDQGVALIEGNDYWSVELLQMPAPHGLMRGDFKALCDEMACRDRDARSRRKRTYPRW